MSEDRRPLQDTIHLQLRDEVTVTNDTVRLTVPIIALIDGDTAEETIRSDIRAALAKFIPGTDWQFNSIYRTPDGTGHERMQLNAVARVSERENYRLGQRAKDASRTGLQINAPHVDTTIPNAKLEEAETKLRASLVTKAVSEMKALTAAAGRSYRLHSVNFLNSGDVAHRKSAHLNATVAASASYGSGFAMDSADVDTLSNAQKISLTAEIIFAVNHDWG